MLDFLKYLFQLLISPGKGWEDISYAGKPHANLASEGLFPLLGIAAITVFIGYLYDTDYTLVQLLQKAIVIFVKFFATYFLAGVLFSIFVSKMVDGDLNEKKSQTFIIYNIALLALYSIFENCLPMQLTFVKFLPLYSAIIIWKGIRYLGIKQDSILEFSIFGTATIVVPPFLFSWLFTAIMPS